MKYKIIGTRGVSADGAPFLLDEGKCLELEFEDLPMGEYLLRLTDKCAKTLKQKIINNRASIAAYKLRAGLWYAELIGTDGKEKIILTPIRIHSLANAESGLICYPEIEEILKTVANMVATVGELNAWRAEVAPLIHEHKIIK